MHKYKLTIWYCNKWYIFWNLRTSRLAKILFKFQSFTASRWRKSRGKSLYEIVLGFMRFYGIFLRFLLICKLRFLWDLQDFVWFFLGFMRFFWDLGDFLRIYGIFLGFFRKVYEIFLSDLPLEENSACGNEENLFRERKFYYLQVENLFFFLFSKIILSITKHWNYPIQTTDHLYAGYPYIQIKQALFGVFWGWP